MLIILLACIIYPFVASHDYKQIDLATGAVAPTGEHLFGTDRLGRDLFARCMMGGRYSIFIGVVSALGGAVIGVVLGAIGGYFGGKVDAFIIRVTELFQTFPSLVLNMIDVYKRQVYVHVDQPRKHIRAPGVDLRRVGGHAPGRDQRFDLFSKQQTGIFHGTVGQQHASVDDGLQHDLFPPFRRSWRKAPPIF